MGKTKLNLEDMSLYVRERGYELLEKEYINTKMKMEFSHDLCGNSFFMSWDSFKHNNQGCPKCFKTEKLTIEECLDFAGKNGYKIFLSEYMNNKMMVDFLHLECNRKFKMRWNSFYNKNTRCPLCRESKGEIEIENFLNIVGMKINLDYFREFRFPDCKYKNPLPFDFYIPELKTCIEFNGEQHYKEVDWFGGRETFILQKKKDEIKRLFCKKNNIKLIEIPYNKMDKISTILKKNIII